MKIPDRLRPSIFQLWLYASILCAYCLYQLHWAPNKSLSELELSECYTQIYVNGRMVGSGFFLEDVKGWHRNYYLVTDHHVYSLARQAEAATGRGMVLATRDWWTGKTQFALLGTSEYVQCGNTDLVCVPILPPWRQRILFRRAMRFVRLDRDWLADEKAPPPRGGVHMLDFTKWDDSGVCAKGEASAFHHRNDIPPPEKNGVKKWEDVVTLVAGYIQHLPVMRPKKGGYDQTLTFGIFTATLPGDSGSLVFTKKDRTYYAFGIIESIYTTPDGRGNQIVFSTSAIPSDYIAHFLPPPSWKVKYYQHPLLNVMVLAGWLYILLPHPKRPDQTPNATTNTSAADGPPSEGR